MLLVSIQTAVTHLCSSNCYCDLVTSEFKLFSVRCSHYIVCPLFWSCCTWHLKAHFQILTQVSHHNSSTHNMQKIGQIQRKGEEKREKIKRFLVCGYCISMLLVQTLDIFTMNHRADSQIQIKGTIFIHNIKYSYLSATEKSRGRHRSTEVQVLIFLFQALQSNALLNIMSVPFIKQSNISFI